MISGMRRALLGVLATLSLPVASMAADAKAGPARLTAAEIVRKHVVARGGLDAWRGVQSIEWNGKLDVGYGDSIARSERYASSTARRGKGAHARPAAESKKDERKQVQVPFVLDMKRPAKSRFEIVFAGQTAVQVYDGTQGWLLRPYLNRDDWEPFTAEQARSQHGKWEIGGPLIDHAARGARVELVSTERVEGSDAYKLRVTEKSGEAQLVWVDAKTFLDVKSEGIPRRMDGKMRRVWVTQRDFRPVHGLMVPFVLETVVDGFADKHAMIIEKVALNPRLDDARFAKPKA